jgi:glycine dehydrogenase
MDRFENRHLGPRNADISVMLKALGCESMDQLIQQAVPAAIRLNRKLDLGALPASGESEHEALSAIRAIANKNEVRKSYIGMGYHGTVTPPVILRNILENPGWYTQYTPYQAEIAQGRLEALLNFQTLIMDLTGMEMANASLLDEGTAAAEAMAMCLGLKGREKDGKAREFFVSELCHPQTIEVVRARAAALSVPVVVGDHRTYAPTSAVLGALVQYPGTNGEIFDYQAFFEKIHAADGMTVTAADILSLTLLRAPAEFGSDIAVGSTQRFGVPMGFGGPHAAYLSTRDAYKRLMPGRIVGLSKDSEGKPAIRLALQTREQHIRRDKATSNICTAQVLLAVMASMYAVYHGPEGLTRIASRVRQLTLELAAQLKTLGLDVENAHVFDTITIRVDQAMGEKIRLAAEQRKMNLRHFADGRVGVSLDETTSRGDLASLIAAFAQATGKSAKADETLKDGGLAVHERKSAFMQHPVFHKYRSESEMMRYINRLRQKDLSLVHSMIPLGSCTMKLNAAAEMLPITWPEFGALHPFAPSAQTQGYQHLTTELERWLSEITGFAGVSLQPNAGSAGEYAGLLVIRRYLESKSQGHRNVCLIPLSAHGTNPASAVMAGMSVVGVKTDDQGNIDVQDLRAKAQENAGMLAALMVTYPSTHGVFEESIKEVCAIIHEHGGQVYMDGANMNAQVGLCRPGDFGADVCHLNLHKTFCIPHGGGGPGMGPICTAAHLVPFLPGHPVIKTGGSQGIGAISAAPWGSASILPISYMYIRMMGAEGLKKATEVAILNANYMANRLEVAYPVLYRGTSGRVAHECILDLRAFKAHGIEVEDVAKRLMDYGYHAPTVSWPVAGTMMIEPTESESKEEMDRFCDAMLAIHSEITAIAEGRMDRARNPLKLAPHTAEQVTRTEWDRPYTREMAAYPLAWVRESKFWPSVARIDNVYGDRNLFCSCAPVEA